MGVTISFLYDILSPLLTVTDIMSSTKQYDFPSDPLSNKSLNDFISANSSESGSRLGTGILLTYSNRTNFVFRDFHTNISLIVSIIISDTRQKYKGNSDPPKGSLGVNII